MFVFIAIKGRSTEPEKILSIVSSALSAVSSSGI
jgi:hypothetical protein